MNKLLLVALNEYKRNVFKKSFIIALLSVPLMIALQLGVGFVMESVRTDDAPVGYVDHASLLTDPIPAPVRGSSEPVELIPFATEEAARAALDSGEVQAFYVISADYYETSQVDLFYLDEPGENAARQFYDFLQINLAADQPPEIAHRVSDGTHVIVRSLDGRRFLPPGGPTVGLLLPLLTGMVFLFLLLMNSSYLMQALVEEKESRTMEILATSISPTQLISGKVLGVVGISATQLVVWVVVAILAVIIANNAGITWFQDLQIDWEALVGMAAVSIPAYLLSGALMTAVGATVTSAQESQATGALFIILHLVPTYLSWAIIGSPNGPLSIIMTLAPFTAIMTITMRNLFAAIPLWQIGASFLVQTLCAIGALWLAGRAVRIGMLRYGQRLKWRELLNARSR